LKTHLKVPLLCFLIFAGTQSFAQQYLVLQKTGTVKNFKYQVGNEIALKVERGEYVFSGRISQIKDSSIVLNSLNEIFLSEITHVYKKRTFVRVLSKVLLFGGIGYVGLEGVNGLINDYSPVISQNTIIISASMVATSFALRPFYTRKFDTREKYVLKILDFEKLE
jgi:hypothetical protein